MCRRYWFRCAECGHIATHLDWEFRWSHHPASCKMEKVVIERPWSCFRCLGRERMPAEPRKRYARRADPSICSDRLSRIFIHHIKHPNGPQHFDRANTRALWEITESLSKADRLYVEKFEEECENWLWEVKDVMEDHRNPDLRERFRDQRSMVLQLRYAHLSALVQEMEYDEIDEETTATASAEFYRRCHKRVQALLAPVREDKLAKDDSCSICFRNLLALTRFGTILGHGPVRLPCGHMFSRMCIVTWLSGDIRTCPSCRADFSLTRDDNADWDVTEINLDNKLYNVANSPTPWWVKLLRGQQYRER